MHNFADLRVDQVASKGDDSFWPSFTDIMTVIVMIFLIATSMLILQNWKLISELTDTVQAKEKVQALAQSANEENQTLEEQLTHIQSQLAMLRLNKMQIEDERAELELLRDQQKENISFLKQQAEQLDLRLNQAFQKTDLVAEQLRLSLQENRDLDSNLQTKDALINQQKASLIEQQTNLSAKDIELAALSRLKENSTNKLEQLNTKFSVLKTKYDKLVRPARSARGKTVVELRYTKHKKVLVTELKLPTGKEFKKHSNVALHKELTKLKKKLGKQLYIKIILPEDSGLSYNEAWKFTRGVLQKYDYYQEEQ